MPTPSENLSRLLAAVEDLCFQVEIDDIHSGILNRVRSALADVKAAIPEIEAAGKLAEAVHHVDAMYEANRWASGFRPDAPLLAAYRSAKAAANSPEIPDGSSVEPSPAAAKCGACHDSGQVHVPDPIPAARLVPCPDCGGGS